MPEHDSAPLRPPRSNASTGIVATVLALLIAAGATWWFWGRTPEPPAAPPAAMAPEAVATPAPPEASGPQNPLEALQPADAGLPDLAASDAHVADALVPLLGRGAVASLLQTDGLVRRVVATVDNLTRSQAPARVWPVHPTAPRFLVEGQGDAQSIAAANAQRYAALLSVAEVVPKEALATVYARLYPLFQQAYEELGYPRGYFNDRLVAVLDHLLQAPEPQGPLRVQLTEVKGELRDPRPWVRYEFADPELQALSSGQKILVRMGLANERRAKAALAEFRHHVATGAVARK